MANRDVLAPAGRRRVFRAEEKAPLLAEIDAEGGRVRLVARGTVCRKACSIIGRQRARHRRWRWARLNH